MIWVEIEFPNYKVLLCVVYRCPGATQSFWQNFEYSIEETFNYTTNVIITGLLMLQRYKLKLLRQNSFYLFLIYLHGNLGFVYLYLVLCYLDDFQVSSVVCYKFVFKEFCKNITFTLILLMLGNDISENPGPFDNEISIFHLNIIHTILIFNNTTISITIHVSQSALKICRKK
jgi:hypothetical protein